MAIDLDAISAIDIHTHVQVSNDGHYALSNEIMEASAKYFKADRKAQPTIDEMAAYYKSISMAAVIFTVDAENATGIPRISNTEIAENCARHPDVLIPFASIDPWKGKAGAREAKELVTNHGVKGFKFHPSVQGFAPNDRIAYPLYETIEELGVPALFHTGQTGIGAGLPGGGGIRLSYSNPMLIDDVAVDFPGITIILAHPSFPWQDEALSIATHKANVFIDLSGWSPKYFPPQLVHYANTLIQDKVLFGSDFPFIDPSDWIRAFDRLEIRPEVRPKILKTNAAKVLGLA